MAASAAKRRNEPTVAAQKNLCVDGTRHEAAGIVWLDRIGLGTGSIQDDDLQEGSYGYDGE